MKTPWLNTENDQKLQSTKYQAKEDWPAELLG
jgi:hypothetical protein